MIGDLKPYPAMKDSGVPWLGKVPEHWEVFPLKRVGKAESSGSYGIEPEQGQVVLPVATTAQLDRDGAFAVGRMPERGFSKYEVDRFGCRVGDVLIVKSSGSAANVISGKAGIVRSGDAHFVFSNFLLRLRARENRMSPEYLFLTLTMNLTRERVKMMVSATTYPNLKIDEYLSAVLPCPPLREQTGIVRFLDHADRRIRRYIRAKQKLIKLLEEQRQAIAHRAVTRGLDPSVPLKPSGVEWLGDVPKHWEVVRNGQIFVQRNQTGFRDLPILEVSLNTGVRMRDFERLDRKQVMTDRDKYKRAVAGDVAYNTMRMWQGCRWGHPS